MTVSGKGRQEGEEAPPPLCVLPADLRLQEDAEVSSEAQRQPGHDPISARGDARPVRGIGTLRKAATTCLVFFPRRRRSAHEATIALFRRYEVTSNMYIHIIAIIVMFQHITTCCIDK